MTEQQMTFDEVDISRGRHIRTSHAAFNRGHAYHAAMRERCLVWVRSCGFHGTTTKEIARNFGVEIHCISGRISELLRDGAIFDSGRERRDNCRILVAKREWCNGSAA